MAVFGRDESAVVHGAIDHTPGVYIIDPQGRERSLYLTEMAYGGMGQQAQVLAEEVARLLPKPTTTSQALLHRALAQEAGIHNLAQVTLPTETARGKGLPLTLKDGHAHLLVLPPGFRNCPTCRSRWQR